MTPQACREAGISEQAYYHWCKKYSGLKLDQARRRLKALEQENAKLKRLVAELSLEKQILKDVKDVAEANCKPRATPGGSAECASPIWG